MKYIRTKDELGIEREDGTCYFKTWAAYFSSSLKEDWIYADTVEELCDEFVVYVKDNIKAIRMFPKGKAMEYSTYLKQTDNLDSEIYGAIWTDKGLIYVAKINEKGELELL